MITRSTHSMSLVVAVVAVAAVGVLMGLRRIRMDGLSSLEFAVCGTLLLITLFAQAGVTGGTHRLRGFVRGFVGRHLEGFQDAELLRSMDRLIGALRQGDGAASEAEAAVRGGGEAGKADDDVFLEPGNVAAATAAVRGTGSAGATTAPARVEEFDGVRRSLKRAGYFMCRLQTMSRAQYDAFFRVAALMVPDGSVRSAYDVIVAAHSRAKESMTAIST